MPQSKQPANELPVTDNNAVELAEPSAETSAETTKTAAQILLERKAAVANNRNLPPHLNAHPSHKSQKIGAAPRGTRKSMGKR